MINYDHKRRANIVSAALIFLFVYTATSKLISFNSFKIVLSKAPLLRHFPIVAILVPAIEFIISGLLIFNTTKLSGLYGAAGLLLAFTLYIGCLILFSPVLPCGCGGVLKQLSWPQHFFFNLFFIVLSLYGVNQQRKWDNSVSHVMQ